MGHDPAEKCMPKSVAQPKTARPGELMEKFRWQGPVAGQDEIHVHDDAKNLVFVWHGGRSFRIHWQEFLSMRGQMEPGDVLAFYGETSNPGKGRKTAVMLWEKMSDGSFEMSLAEYDKGDVYEYEIRASQLIAEVDDWVEKKC